MKKPRATFWLATVLIGGFWAVRLIALDTYPPFGDEGIHIRWAEQDMLTSPLAHASEGRLLIVWLNMAAQPFSAGGFWLARSVIILGAALGYAAAVGIGRQAAGKWGMLFVGLLVLFSTYHQYFDRMAMADVLAASFMTVGLYFAYRLSHRVNLWDAALCGACLFLAVSAKNSIVPYYGIPLAAFLTLSPPRTIWSARWKWLAVAMGVLLGLTALLTASLHLLGYNYWTLITHHNPSAGDGPIERLFTNLAIPLEAVAGFAGPAALILLIAATGVLIVRREFFLPLVLIAPLLITALSQRQSARFYHGAITILFIGAGIGAAYCLRRRSRVAKRGMTALILGWGVFTWLPFTMVAISDPASLPLPEVVRREYVASDNSGFGLAEVAAVLRQHNAREVIGLSTSCLGLRYLTLGADFTVTCPRVNPNREDIPAHQTLMESRREPGVFVVLEDSPYVPDSAPGEPVAVIEHESGRPRLTIYDLTPR